MLKQLRNLSFVIRFITSGFILFHVISFAKAVRPLWNSHSSKKTLTLFPSEPLAEMKNSPCIFRRITTPPFSPFQIFSCEVHFPSSPDSPYQAPSRLASARCLRSSAPADASCRLRAEAEPLSRVSDPHVTRLLGVCTVDESPCLLVEYMERGDLNQFLRRTPHEPGRPSQRPLE